MKTSSPLHDSAQPFCRRLLLLVAVLITAALPAVADPAAPESGEPKPYTLFMGADFSVMRAKELHRVCDVTGGSFVIDLKGKRVPVPMQNGPVSLQVDQSLKLTQKAATVTKLIGERAYTPGNDPRIKEREAQAAMLNMADQAQVDHKRREEAEFMQDANEAFQSPLGRAQALQKASVARLAGDNLQRSVRSDFNNPARAYGTMIDELSSEMFDAMDVKFEVSAETPLNQPYMVIITRYREKDSKPGEVKNWIYAEELDAITQKTNKIHVRRGGFPPGFVLVDFQLHLYNHGEEVATNVSPKRVPLSQNEAFQYVLMEYVSSHKDATLPAVPVMGRMPPDFAARLKEGELPQIFYVKVSKDGEGTEAFLDETCSQKAENPYLDMVVKGLRFKPALDKGKPVNGVSAVKPAELPLG